MKDIKDIHSGDFLWYSKQGAIGQLRVTGVDMQNNIIKYATVDNKDCTAKLDDNFYTKAQDAFDAARNYNNKWMKDIKQGGFGTEVVYNTPQEVDNKEVRQMLLD